MSNDKETVIFRRNKNTKNSNNKEDKNLNNLDEPVTETIDYGTLDDMGTKNSKEKRKK